MEAGSPVSATPFKKYAGTASFSAGAPLPNTHGSPKGKSNASNSARVAKFSPTVLPSSGSDERKSLFTSYRVTVFQNAHIPSRKATFAGFSSHGAEGIGIFDRPFVSADEAADIIADASTSACT